MRHQAEYRPDWSLYWLLNAAIDLDSMEGYAKLALFCKKNYPSMSLAQIYLIHSANREFFHLLESNVSKSIDIHV